MSMYEIGKFIVYNFTVHCIVYSKLLFLTSLQVFLTRGTSDSLQQIVGTYKSLTNRELLHFCTVVPPISELLHFFHCLHVQEQHGA